MATKHHSFGVRGYAFVETLHDDIVASLSTASDPDAILHRFLAHAPPTTVDDAAPHPDRRDRVRLSRGQRETCVSLAFCLRRMCTVDSALAFSNPSDRGSSRTKAALRLSRLLSHWLLLIPNLKNRQDNAAFATGVGRECCLIISTCSDTLLTLSAAKSNSVSRISEEHISAIRRVQHELASAFVQVVRQLTMAVSKELKEKRSRLTSSTDFACLTGLLDVLARAEVAPAVVHWPGSCRENLFRSLWPVFFGETLQGKGAVDAESTPSEVFLELHVSWKRAWDRSHYFTPQLRSACLQALTNLLAPGDASDFLESGPSEMFSSLQDLARPPVTVNGSHVHGQMERRHAAPPSLNLRGSSQASSEGGAPASSLGRSEGAFFLEVLGLATTALYTRSPGTRQAALEALSHCASLCPQLQSVLAVRLLDELHEARRLWQLDEPSSIDAKAMLVTLSPGPLAALLTAVLQVCVSVREDGLDGAYLPASAVQLAREGSNASSDSSSDSSTDSSNEEEGLEESKFHSDPRDEDLDQSEELNPSLRLARQVLLTHSTGTGTPLQGETWSEPSNGIVEVLLSIEGGIGMGNATQYRSVLAQTVHILESMLELQVSNWDPRRSQAHGCANLQRVLGQEAADRCIRFISNTLLDVLQYEMEEFVAVWDETATQVVKTDDDALADMKVGDLTGPEHDVLLWNRQQPIALTPETAFTATETYGFIQTLTGCVVEASPFSTFVESSIDESDEELRIWRLDRALWMLALLKQAVVTIRHPMVTVVACTLLTEQADTILSYYGSRSSSSSETLSPAVERCRAIHLAAVFDALSVFAMQVSEVSTAGDSMMLFTQSSRSSSMTVYRYPLCSPHAELPSRVLCSLVFGRVCDYPLFEPHINEWLIVDTLPRTRPPSLARFPCCYWPGVQARRRGTFQDVAAGPACAAHVTDWRAGVDLVGCYP